MTGLRYARCLNGAGGSGTTGRRLISSSSAIIRSARRLDCSRSASSSSRSRARRRRSRSSRSSRSRSARRSNDVCDVDGESQTTLATRVWDSERRGGRSPTTAPTDGERTTRWSGRSSTMMGRGRLSSTILGGTIGEFGAVKTWL